MKIRMTRRTVLFQLAASLARAATQLPSNRKIRWAVGANLWNFYPHVAFMDILDIMRDTGFVGVRLTQFPGILQRYQITATQMEKEVSRRGLNVVTISFNGPAHNPAATEAYLSEGRKAMQFLKPFGARHLVVFSPEKNARFADQPGAFATMCKTFDRLGEVAGEMGFRAGLHSHLAQMVETPAEIDRAMALTSPHNFWLSPDTAHIYLAGGNPAQILEKQKHRIMFVDYKDAWRKGLSIDFRQNTCDLGQGEIDFAACHRVLKSMRYEGWICVDLDIALQGPRASYERCSNYVVRRLEPIYS